MRAMLIGMLGLVAFACGSSGPQAFLDTDKTTIRASLDSFTVYVVQHRDSTAAAMYAENATFMPPNQGMVQGRAAILAWMKTDSRGTAGTIDARTAASEIMPFSLPSRTEVIATTGEVRLRRSWYVRSG